jgi:hypothetical protein
VIGRARDQLAAALAIATAVTVATGYAVTWARLGNAGVPRETVMASLPTTAYVVTAVESIALPLALIAVGSWGIAFGLISVERSPEFPRPGRWALVGLLLAAPGWILSVVFRTAGDRSLGDIEATIWCLLIAAYLAGFTAALGDGAARHYARLERRAADGSEADWRPERTRSALSAGIIILASVLSAGLFATFNAWMAEVPFRTVSVFTDAADCPVSAKIGQAKPGCQMIGLYIGGSGDWLYVVPIDEVRQPDSALARDYLIQDRLTFVARARVRQVRLGDTLQDVLLDRERPDG